MQEIIRKYSFSVLKTVIENNMLWVVKVDPPMSNQDYNKIKFCIERIGGHWRERVKGFAFTYDPSENLIENSMWTQVQHTERKKWVHDRQFYPTPSEVAKRVIELADIKSGMDVLEPSAGRGNLADMIGLPRREITAVEIDEDNFRALKRKGYDLIHSSFEEAAHYFRMGGTSFDRVVMNPPFSGKLDAKYVAGDFEHADQIGLAHIMLAYDLLKPGGILVAIASENDLYYQTQFSEYFRKFLQETNAQVESVPLRAFANSGTSVDTVIIKVQKKDGGSEYVPSP